MLDKRKFYINGQWVDPSNKNDFEVINPSDESVCAIISLGAQEDTDAAVSAARAALPMWSSSSKEERIALLERLYAIYQRRMDEMAEVISIEMGAPIDFSKAAQAPSGTNAIEDFLNQLKKFVEENIPDLEQEEGVEYKNNLYDLYYYENYDEVIIVKYNVNCKYVIAKRYYF